MKKIILILAVCMAAPGARAQSLPPMDGIAKMTYLVSSRQMAQEYYGDLLGFERAFSYSSPLGAVDCYKVNDRQFLELIEDKQASVKDRFVSITLQTDPQAMYVYLVSKGVEVSEVTTDGASNRVCSAVDDRGHRVEFADMGPGSLYSKSKGQFLSERRISTRIHHAGLFLNAINNLPHFWTEILGFKELLRIPADHSLLPTVAYYVMPGNTESIECFSNGATEPDRDFEHPCFLTMDMQATIDTLRQRDKSGTRYIPTVGRTGRWLLNIANPDGTKVEFTEPYNIK